MSKQSRQFPVPLYILNLPTLAPFRSSEDKGADDADHCRDSWSRIPQPGRYQKANISAFTLSEGLPIAKVVSSEARGEDSFPLAEMVLFQKPMFQDELESI